MRNFEWNDNSSLCCCEYYSLEDERSHILGCCCNCQDFDECFEGLITNYRVSGSRRANAMATIQDRIRIPWRGGAKQLSADSLIPVFLVPIAIFVAAFDLILTIIVFTLIPLFLTHAQHWFKSNYPKTKFFIVWNIMSFTVVAVIFEVKVISLLEILPEENLALGILMGLFVFCVYRLKLSASQWQNSILVTGEESNVEDANFCSHCKKKVVERMYHCSICQVCVPERDYHFIWYDCCIGQSNNGTFVLSLLFAISSLLYSSNLTLTTVCHPFTVFETVMLPDDCSEVYEQYDMAICFVTAVYSILIAVYLLWILLKHCLIITIGISGQEWRLLPLSSKLCCGLVTHRPYSRGVFKNWLKLMCNNDKTRTTTYVDT